MVLATQRVHGRPKSLERLAIPSLLPKSNATLACTRHKEVDDPIAPARLTCDGDGRELPNRKAEQRPTSGEFPTPARLDSCGIIIDIDS